MNKPATFRTHQTRPYWAGARSIMAEREITLDLDLAEVVRNIYTSILNVSNGASLFRVWNAVPRINQGEGDEENYRLFCQGRLQAFEAVGIDTFPVATAVGSADQALRVEAWFTEAAGIPIPNPWQTEAFHYPPCYGPASPSFSRAMLWPGDRSLWVSGTAAIRGHESTCPNDLIGQLDCTLENIRILVQETERRFGITRFHPSSLKAYVRHSRDRQTVSVALANWAPQALIELEIADICRRELLVEVEGVFQADG